MIESIKRGIKQLQLVAQFKMFLYGLYALALNTIRCTETNPVITFNYNPHQNEKDD